MYQFISVCFVLFAITLSQECHSQKSEGHADVKNDARKLKSDDVLWHILDNCVTSEVNYSVSTCLKLQVLQHFDSDVSRIDSPRNRSMSDKQAIEKIDRMVVKRFERYLKSRQFKVQLPEFLFQKAILVFDPKKGYTDFDVLFPTSSDNEGRSIRETPEPDLTQHNGLLPLLLMLKLKLKMITPILLTLVSIKATKAFLISKLALFLVTVFIVSQVLKKVGMNLPMLHSPKEIMSMSITTPAAVYGPPPSPSSSYGSPAQFSHYAEPDPWEQSSSSSNKYAKIWDAQQVAYNAYYKSSSSPSFSTSSSVR